MSKTLIGIARFALTAWVGAAALFVVTGIREVRSPLLDSYVRDVLVGIRFPAYYAFGFALVGIGCVALIVAGCFANPTHRRPLGLGLLVIIALVLMVSDFVWIYRPLLEMITPPGESRPAEFVAYHTASKWINLASVSLCALAAAIPWGHKPND